METVPAGFGGFFVAGLRLAGPPEVYDFGHHFSLRAFPAKVASGFPFGNATNKEDRAYSRFSLKRKGSSAGGPARALPFRRRDRVWPLRCNRLLRGSGRLCRERLRP